MKQLKSEYISDIIQFFNQTKKDYEQAYNQVNIEDKLTQDLLHKLELGGLKAPERNKLAKQLEINRLDRRYYKDIVEELQPIVEFYNNHTKSLNCLTQLMGEVRKIENYHKDRVYIPRVLKKEK